jgi:hypothetical protein
MFITKTDVYRYELPRLLVVRKRFFFARALAAFELAAMRLGHQVASGFAISHSSAFRSKSSTAPSDH